MCRRLLVPEGLCKCQPCSGLSHACVRVERTYMSVGVKTPECVCTFGDVWVGGGRL